MRKVHVVALFVRFELILDRVVVCYGGAYVLLFLLVCQLVSQPATDIYFL